MRGEFLDVDGARLYCYAAGNRGAGEPIVLLHGFPTSSHLWSRVVPLLPEGHRVVVLDLLGYGRSDRPLGRDVSIRGHAERAIAALDLLGINYACLVGHDVGGGIAMAMAARWPQRVSRLCLVNSVCFDEWPSREVRMAKATLPLTRHLPPTWLLSVVRGDLLRGYSDSSEGTHSIDRYVKPFTGAEGRDAFVAHLLALDAAETAALDSRLASFVQPTAIVWGAHDPFLAPSLGRRLQEAIPRATLDVIPDARHFTPEEAPEHVADAVTELLSRE
ncbi:MAG TPA: alpha/beta hydrolase [Gemmatimonadaceae bacterium]|nr:alpha/beta hydrolase [Gemmatimonadaceae bacterium]